MAYSTYFSQNFSAVAGFFDEICGGFVALGWNLHDTNTATDKVYTSSGEGDIFLPGYIRVYVSGSNVLFQAYQFWNATTGVGTGRAYEVDNDLLYDSSNEAIWMYGDHNFTVVYVGSSTSQFVNKWIGFGFVANLLSDTKTALTAGALADSSGVSLTVTSTSGFRTDRKYIIVGSTYGRDVVTVSSITDSTHLVVDDLDYDAVSGDTIGEHPCPFGIMSDDPTKIYCVTDYYISGSGNGTVDDYFKSNFIFNNSAVDPSPSRGRFGLSHVMWCTQRAGYEYQLGFINEDILYAPVSDTSILRYGNNFYTTQRLTLGCIGVTGSGGSNRVTDSTKSWVTDEFVGKVLLLESGTCKGETLKITSNTGTVIYGDHNWIDYTDIIEGDYFGVYEKVHRQIGYLAMKESV